MLEAFLPTTEELLCNSYPVHFSLPVGVLSRLHGTSDLILDVRKLPFPLHLGPFPLHLGKYFEDFGKKLPK